MLKASIDLGTNTCLLLIADFNSNENVKTVEDYSTVVRLGEGVDQKRELQPVPMERVLKCLKEYAQTVKRLHLSPEKVVAVATSQARDAKNSDEFFSRIQRETGFVFRTLSGDEEAHYTFTGALLPGMNPEHTAVIDIGGGSTEVTTVHVGQSVDIGSVRVTERYLKSDPVSEAEFNHAMNAIKASMTEYSESLKEQSKALDWVGVAGTITTLAAWSVGQSEFDREKIDSVILNQNDVWKMLQELKKLKLSEKQKLPGMSIMRADVILAGTMILWQAMESLGFKKCRVSTRGLRYGVLNLGT